MDEQNQQQVSDHPSQKATTLGPTGNPPPTQSDPDKTQQQPQHNGPPGGQSPNDVPPGMYRASDGNVYPLAAMPQHTPAGGPG